MIDKSFTATCFDEVGGARATRPVGRQCAHRVDRSTVRLDGIVLAARGRSSSYPLHVVTAWIGNSEPVAAKHGLQLTDEHFRRAATEQAAQNAAQKLTMGWEMTRKRNRSSMRKTRYVPGIASPSGYCGLPHGRESAGGGTRTHTGGEPQRILNPSRLPIPPHRLSG